MLDFGESETFTQFSQMPHHKFTHSGYKYYGNGTEVLFHEYDTVHFHIITNQTSTKPL